MARSKNRNLTLPRPASRRAFTLIELMVSVGVLVILLTMVGMIFSMATTASGKATANNEVLGNLRALEYQLRRDFEGLQKDAFIGLWYQLRGGVTDWGAPEGAPRQTTVRTDRIVFFSAGDYSAFETCVGTDPSLASFGDVVPCDAPAAEPIRSPMARVFYGHNIAIEDPNYDKSLESWVLARSQKLLVPPGSINVGAGGVLPTAEFELWQIDELVRPNFPMSALFAPNTGVMNEAWRNPGQPGQTTWIDRPRLWIPNVGDAYEMICLPGVAEFKVQRWVEKHPIDGSTMVPPRWYPEEDRDGDGTTVGTSDFIDWGSDHVREFVSTAHPMQSGIGLHPVLKNRYMVPGNDGGPDWLYVPMEEAPKAIKITVRLYDTNQRLDNGQRFTMVFPLK